MLDFIYNSTAVISEIPIFLVYRDRDSVLIDVHLQFNLVERILFHFVTWIIDYFFFYFSFHRL